MKNYLDELSPEDRVRSRKPSTMEGEGISADFTFAHRCSNRGIDFLQKHGPAVQMPFADIGGMYPVIRQPFAQGVGGKDGTFMKSRKIVFIMTDSQRWDMVNCYRNTGLSTPSSRFFSPRATTRALSRERGATRESTKEAMSLWAWRKQALQEMIKSKLTALQRIDVRGKERPMITSLSPIRMICSNISAELVVSTSRTLGKIRLK